MSKQAFKRLRRALRMEVSREPLPSYAWPGGYPLFYLTEDNSILCPDCVNAESDSCAAAMKDRDKQWWVVAVGVHWEGEPLTCDHCDGEIESAYGVPEGEEQS